MEFFSLERREGRSRYSPQLLIVARWGRSLLPSQHPWPEFIPLLNGQKLHPKHVTGCAEHQGNSKVTVNVMGLGLRKVYSGSVSIITHTTEEHCNIFRFINQYHCPFKTPLIISLISCTFKGLSRYSFHYLCLLRSFSYLTRITKDCW